MDIYLKRENGISLQEWIDYVNADEELALMEFGEAIHPITRQKMKVKMEGRALFDGNYEILYKNGCVGCDGDSERVSAKLREIARSLGAEIFE